MPEGCQSVRKGSVRNGGRGVRISSRTTPSGRARSRGSIPRAMTKVYAGVDLGGTKIQAVVLRSRKVAGSARVLTPQTGAPDVIAAIAGTVRTSLEQAGASLKDLAAIG